MKSILITLTLLIPPASQGVDWDMNEVPNQMVITHKNGVKASYSTIQVPCHTEPQHEHWVLYKTKSMGQEVCYLTDTNYPLMVRGPWKPTINKTFNKE
jgi:hypothetical protein